MVDNEVMVIARFSRILLLLAGGLALRSACRQDIYESQRQAMIEELRDALIRTNRTNRIRASTSNAVETLNSLSSRRVSRWRGCAEPNVVSSAYFVSVVAVRFGSIAAAQISLDISIRVAGIGVKRTVPNWSI